jgi:seryl-tRNA synthetase
MLDKRFLRDNPAEAKKLLGMRGDEFAAMVDEFIDLDAKRRATQTELDELRSKSNAISKEIGSLMKSGQRDEAESIKTQVKELKQRIASLDGEFSAMDTREREILLGAPNFPDPKIPVGGEECAEEIKRVGDHRSFDFEPRDHVELCSNLHLVNFEAGARLAGSGFPVMHGQGAVLQRALINFMLDVHLTEHGYTELRPPFMVHPRCPLGTGQLPKFGDEMYHVSIQGQDTPDDIPDGQPHYYLIPTAEVPVVNYYRDQIIESPVLPLKLCAYSPCWRVEAGSYGKEARGLTRLHQFEKVELVMLVDPEKSEEAHQQITRESERILELLGLSYRLKLLPTGDMAFGSAKTYDIEVSCPGEQAWREVSSASNTTDWQSRRANIRFRPEQGAKPVFPHMLNSSGVALPRLMVALLETYQTAEGTIKLPEVLHRYMPGGLTKLTPPDGKVPMV